MKNRLSLRLGAVGDISFEGSQANHVSVASFGDVPRVLGDCDLVVGNLEGPLVTDGTPTPGKCALRGSPEWAAVLRDAGIGIVSLANNHIMDYGEHGLLGTLQALRHADVQFVGAGTNRKEACAPLLLDIGGVQIALLGRSGVIVSSPCYASDNNPGVAFLDPDETAAAIHSARAVADLVILLVHWGIEDYSYPSPSQRHLARRLIDAGANAIIGHHPHVIQGFEYRGTGVIAYSLGNLIFNEFEWRCVLPDGSLCRQFSPLSSDNTKGVVATFGWAQTQQPTMSAVYTRIEPHGRVRIDLDSEREREMTLLTAGLSRKPYRLWWYWYAMRREWRLRLKGELSFWKLVTDLHRLRLRHVISLFRSIRRSARMVSEKSTNPYE